LGRPDRFTNLNEIIVKPDMFDSDGKMIPDRLTMKTNIDENIRNIRELEKNGSFSI
jgi:hypothetical protein